MLESIKQKHVRETTPSVQRALTLESSTRVLRKERKCARAILALTGLQSKLPKLSESAELVRGHASNRIASRRVGLAALSSTVTQGSRRRSLNSTRNNKAGKQEGKYLK